jgi:hypothetical protein
MKKKVLQRNLKHDAIKKEVEKVSNFITANIFQSVQGFYGVIPVIKQNRIIGFEKGDRKSEGNMYFECRKDNDEFASETYIVKHLIQNHNYPKTLFSSEFVQAITDANKPRIVRAKIFDASQKHPKIIAENIFEEGLILDLEQPLSESELYLLIPKLTAEEMDVFSLFYAIDDVQVIFTDEPQIFNNVQKEENQPEVSFKRLISSDLNFLLGDNTSDTPNYPDLTLDQWGIFWKLQSSYLKSK